MYKRQGENLGTVPEGFDEALGDHGLLGMDVLWFMREPSGPGAAATFLAPEAWPPPAAAMTTTHDVYKRQVRVLAPGARSVSVVGPQEARHPLHDDGDGLFSGAAGPGRAGEPGSYRLDIEWPGALQRTHDPYAFGPLLPADALRELAAGGWRASLEWLGARPATVAGIAGLRCAVWAPNARRVAVVGDFNSWDPRRHGMRLRHEAGVWELFVPDVEPGAAYKFAVTDATGAIRFKACLLYTSRCV